MKEENCIFCRIITGEIPSTVVYEDDKFYAILDISPAAKGHVVILAKNHAANIFELEQEEAVGAFVVAKKIATAMKKAFNCDGVNILQNNGTAAGQTVFHFHVHVIPRYEDDSVQMTWAQGTYQEGEMSQVAEKIKKCFNHDGLLFS